MQETQGKKQRRVQSLETGGAVLHALVALGGEAKLRDLADAVGVSAAQLHPYLVSLRNVDLVEQNAQGAYGLGPFALQMGLVRLQRLDAYQVTLESLPEVVDQLGVMAVISVWGDHGPTIVYLREGRLQVHAMIRLGNTFAMNSTATGRLFAAFDPSPTVAALAAHEAQLQREHLARLGISDLWLEERISCIREQGFDIADGVPVPGIKAISVPIFDHLGRMRLAVTVIGAEHVLGIETGGPETTYMKTWSSNVSARLGYHRQE